MRRSFEQASGPQHVFWTYAQLYMYLAFMARQVTSPHTHMHRLHVQSLWVNRVNVLKHECAVVCATCVLFCLRLRAFT